MIKYARNGKTIPHERVLKMDANNLVCNSTDFNLNFSIVTKDFNFNLFYCTLAFIMLPS